MATLRRSRLAAIYQMKLVAVVVTICVGTDEGLIRQTKALTSLLADAYALCNFSAAVALCKLIRICIRLDRGSILNNRIKKKKKKKGKDVLILLVLIHIMKE